MIISAWSSLTHSKYFFLKKFLGDYAEKCYDPNQNEVDHGQEFICSSVNNYAHWESANHLPLDPECKYHGMYNSVNIMVCIIV